jgi:aquaporin Z
MQLSKRWVAEFNGTFWLVFGGCGSAVLGAVFGAKLEGTPFNIGISHLGVSFAFGLTVLTMASASRRPPRQVGLIESPKR